MRRSEVLVPKMVIDNMRTLVICFELLPVEKIGNDEAVFFAGLGLLSKGFVEYMEKIESDAQEEKDAARNYPDTHV